MLNLYEVYVETEAYQSSGISIVAASTELEAIEIVNAQPDGWKHVPEIKVKHIGYALPDQRPGVVTGFGGEDC